MPCPAHGGSGNLPIDTVLTDCYTAGCALGIARVLWGDQHFGEGADMTMLDNLCDVCRQRPAVGVASTSVPFSCAFCVTCLQHGADPEWVFQYLYTEVMTPGDERSISPGLTTWNGHEYISFQDWALTRGTHGNLPYIC